jgi:transaldolase
MTRLYLDSANTADWAELVSSGLCSRATCNPLLVQAAGWPVNLPTAQTLAQSALDVGLEELHLQAWPDEQGDWEPVAQSLAALGAHIVVKLPATEAAMRAAKVLCRQGTRVLVTAISNPLHALWAAEVGASFVAPYVGRLNEAGRNAHALLEALVALQNKGGPRLLAASIRDLDTLGQVIRLGAYGVTLQKKLLLEGMADPQALLAVEQFERARGESCQSTSV